jgi:uncharacterized protein (DUF3820 family)
MKRFLLLTLALSLLLSLSGCRDGFKIRSDEASEDRSEKTDSMDDEDETEPGITESTATTTTVEETVAETEPAALLPELPAEFLFMSGAGGWSTSLHLNADGTFDGYFSDSDMGDTGEDYPNGTKYECAFSGKFTDICQVSEFEYSMSLEYLDAEGELGSERIEDGVRIFTSDPYGMDDAGEFLLYLPGRATADLPAEYLDWVSMPNVWVEGEIPEVLPFYGLYNVGGMEGFFAG